MSEGTRGHIKDLDSTLHTLNDFNKQYLKEFGDASTPCYLLGNSLGGLISSFLASEASNLDGISYTGVVQAVPYYDIHASQKFDKMIPMI